MPADVGLTAAGLSIHVLSRPYHQAEGGGDVHYISSCGTGRITRLLVADVAGHGADVGKVARTLRDLMRRYVNHIDPRAFVRRMNDEFTELTESGQFATAVIGSYYAPTRRLSLINAGHPPALLYRAKTKSWSLMEDDDDGESVRNIPLGVLGSISYEQFELELEPGDALVCYTDSLPESRDANGELLGYERLLALAAQLDATQPLTQWLKQWLDAIDTVSADHLQNDDLTVLLLRATGRRRQARFHQRLLGLGKMLIAPLQGRPFPWPEFSLKNLGGAIAPMMSGHKKKAFENK